MNDPQGVDGLLVSLLVFAPPGVLLNPRHEEPAVVPNRWQDIIIPVGIEYLQALAHGFDSY